MIKKVSFGIMLATVATLMAPCASHADDTITLGTFELDLSGLVGPAGPEGPAGTGINYKGSVDDCNELRAKTGMVDGDAWYNYEDTLLYIYEDGFPSCPNGGVPFRGPKGEDGKDGKDGATGKDGIPGCASDITSAIELNPETGQKCTVTTITPYTYSKVQGKCIPDTRQEPKESKVCNGLKGDPGAPGEDGEKACAPTVTMGELDTTTGCYTITTQNMDPDTNGECKASGDPVVKTVCNGKDAKKTCPEKVSMSTKDANGCVTISTQQQRLASDNETCETFGTPTTETVCEPEQKCPEKVTKTESTKVVNSQTVSCATVKVEKQVWSKSANKCVVDESENAVSTEMCGGANGQNGANGSSCKTTITTVADGVKQMIVKCDGQEDQETIIKDPCENYIDTKPTTIDGAKCTIRKEYTQERNAKTGVCKADLTSTPVFNQTTCDGAAGTDGDCADKIEKTDFTQAVTGLKCTKVEVVPYTRNASGECVVDEEAQSRRGSTDETTICEGQKGSAGADGNCTDKVTKTEYQKTLSSGEKVTCAKITTRGQKMSNGTCVDDTNSVAQETEICSGGSGTDGEDGCSTTAKSVATGVMLVTTRCPDGTNKEEYIKEPCENYIKTTDTTVDGKSCIEETAFGQTRQNDGACKADTSATPIYRKTTCDGADGKDPECPNSVTTSTVTQDGKQCTQVKSIAQVRASNGKCADDPNATAKITTICSGDKGDKACAPTIEVSAKDNNGCVTITRTETSLVGDVCIGGNTTTETVCDAPVTCQNTVETEEIEKTLASGQKVTCALVKTFATSLNASKQCVKAQNATALKTEEICGGEKGQDGQDAKDVTFSTEIDSETGATKFYAQKEGETQKQLIGTSAPAGTCPYGYYGPFTEVTQTETENSNTGSKETKASVRLYCDKTQH